MKKQLFIGLLASALMVTTIPVTATAAATTTAPVAKITNTATTNSAITTTKSAVSTTGTAITTTSSALTTTNGAVTTTNPAISTGAGINTGAQTPAVVAPISLSLDGAYKKMLADSPQAIIAKYTLDGDISVAKGYSEKLSSMHKLESSNDEASSWALDTSNKPMLEANRTFGNKQAPKNYEASLNKLKSQTYEMYYNYKYTEAQVQVAKDNLDRSQAIYNSTLLKFKLGTVSKLDTLTAETALNTAKDDYTLAVNGLEQMKMNFNLFMGYNIHQKITLTDSLTALAFPPKTLDTSIQEALANRNEISGANYNAEMAQYALDNVKAYPKSSATYLSAQSTLLMAKEGAKTAPEKIEIDIRTKYMDMKQKYEAVNSGKISYENSKEASRLGQLQYTSGVITVTDLSGINFKTFNMQQAYYKAILDYNIAVNAYNLASGIGTEVATIK